MLEKFQVGELMSPFYQWGFHGGESASEEEAEELLAGCGFSSDYLVEFPRRCLIVKQTDWGWLGLVRHANGFLWKVYISRSR